MERIGEGGNCPLFYASYMSHHLTQNFFELFGLPARFDAAVDTGERGLPDAEKPDPACGVSARATRDRSAVRDQYRDACAVSDGADGMARRGRGSIGIGRCAGAGP